MEVSWPTKKMHLVVQCIYIYIYIAFCFALEFKGRAVREEKEHGKNSKHMLLDY